MSGISAAAALTPGKVQSWRRRVFDKCYENMSTDVAKTASMAERSEKNLNELTLLYGEMEYPSYSPDGKYITFNSDRSGYQQIYIMESNGKNIKRISFGNG